ncbi:hypothetical protein [Mucisphaera calidilacus]|uniref:Uncharacterized protein n=1 Tax=Mucisphaera calidilacus TaxID=2527982 RepID=A0A518BZ37_9BACT|nr:hypothetical protein [Mucisphaera calidilacus]QDU72237.1 hypothetical protein Pan265_21010 [Mucisphaera calidilacus]
MGRIGAWVVLVVVCLSGVVWGQEPSVEVGERDELLGWYILTERSPKQSIEEGVEERVVKEGDTLIVVDRHEGRYFATGSRGVEVPFRVCDAGLAWDLEPSSMAGTTIGLDEATGLVTIRIKDALDQRQESGEALPEVRVLVPVDRPAWMPELTAAGPETAGDLAGMYEAAYFPLFRWYVTEGESGFAVMLRWRLRDGTWRDADEGAGLFEVMEDRDGVSGLANGKGLSLRYRRDLERYEVAVQKRSGLLLMPLLRVDADAEAGMRSKVRVGIPSWH